MMLCAFGICTRVGEWAVSQPGLATQVVCTKHVDPFVTWGAPDPESAIRSAVVQLLRRRQAA